MRNWWKLKLNLNTINAMHIKFHIKFYIYYYVHYFITVFTLMRDHEGLIAALLQFRLMQKC